MDNLVENYRGGYSRGSRGSRSYGSYRSVGRYSQGGYRRTMGYIPQTITPTTNTLSGSNHTLGGTGGTSSWTWNSVSPNMLYAYNLYEIANDIKKDKK